MNQTGIITQVRLFAALAWGVGLIGGETAFGATTTTTSFTTPTFFIPGTASPTAANTSQSILGINPAFSTSSPFLQSSPNSVGSSTIASVFGGNPALVNGITPLSPGFQTMASILNSPLGTLPTGGSGGFVARINPFVAPGTSLPSNAGVLNTTLGGFAHVAPNFSSLNAGTTLTPNGLLVNNNATAAAAQNQAATASTGTGGSVFAGNAFNNANPFALGANRINTTTIGTTLPSQTAPLGAVNTPAFGSTSAQLAAAQGLLAGQTSLNTAGLSTSGTTEQIPAVQIIAPNDGAVVAGVTQPLLAAVVLSPDNSVTNLEFFLNGADIGPGTPFLTNGGDPATSTSGNTGAANAVTETAYGISLPVVSPGTYSLTAAATGSSGATTFSEPVLINVQ